MNRKSCADKSFCDGKIEFAKVNKCLFFKVDSYLTNYLSKESVFSQNQETKTMPFLKKSTFTLGEWFNE
jgi:hypothetical protein